jgi:hypothetical protein
MLQGWLIIIVKDAGAVPLARVRSAALDGPSGAQNGPPPTTDAAYLPPGFVHNRGCRSADTFINSDGMIQAYLLWPAYWQVTLSTWR